ncbi:MAG: ABC transporter substrate-binding protein [Promethearchaeota archaeon]
MKINSLILLMIFLFSSILAFNITKTNDDFTNERISIPETSETHETPENPQGPEAPVASESINKKPLEWYYDNLSPDDRKKIRQAMDMAIPRDEIVNGIAGGWGVRETATLIGSQYSPAYDSSIQARDYAPWEALDLLEQVFGYRYNPNANDETRDPYFHMTLIAPISNLARTQWAALIARSFGQIGIDVDLKWWNWNIFMPRIFDDPTGIGFDYEHGGYDAFFVGYSSISTGGMNIDTKGIDYSDLFTSGDFAPDGENTAWINNTEVDDIWDRAINSTSMAERIQALMDFQAWFYDEVPKSVVFHSKDVYAMDSSLSGFDRLHGHNFQNWTLAQTDVTYVQPLNFSSFNPLFSLPASWDRDLSVSENVHGSLTKIRGEHNLTHPVGFLADSWTHSPDYLTWDVTLKQGVLWHDGTEVTAKDVVYTYKAIFNDTIGVDSYLRAVMTDIFGEASNIEQLSTYQVRFKLPDFHPFVESLGFGLTILQKAQMKLIPPSSWRDHGTNLGTEQLQGFGPYYFDGFDGTTVTLRKANTYNDLRMGHDPSATGGGIWWPNASISTAYIKVVSDPKDAFDNLKTGAYDVIDHLMEIEQHYTTIAASTWGKIVETPSWGWQELTYNQYSPIWGMNPEDPRVMYPDPLPEPVSNLEWYYDNLTPDDRKKVRQAMDMAIPREYIVEKVAGGYALKSATPIDEKYVGVYDSSIQAREIDLEQAKDLLQDVFGYRYITWETNGSEDTYFDMTLSAPISRSDRIRWAGLTALNFQQIGINVTLKLWDWGIGTDRIFTDPIDIGFDYNHGGMDAFYIGWTDNPDAVIPTYYSSDKWPPDDSHNYNWIVDANADDISDRAWSSVDIADRIQANKDFQNWYHEEVPRSTIIQLLDLWAMDPLLEGVDPLLGYNIQNWTIGTQTSAVIAQPYDYVNFNPVISDVGSDFYVLDNIFCSLSRRRGAYNITHTVPWLAESWTHSPNYLTWDVILRQGVKWSDGTEVTADDVLFTYQAAMDTDTISPYCRVLEEILGDASNIVKTGTYSVRFTLPQFHPDVETILFGLDLLQKAQMSVIPFADWHIDKTNTEYSPIGCGPYQFDSYDFMDTIVIKVNPYYDETKMGHNPTMLGGGNWLPNPTLTTVTYKIVNTAASAIAGLKDEDWDFIDRNIYIKDWVNEILPSWGKLVNYSTWGFQELGYNQFSPIWGMNPEDPRVMYPLDYPQPEFNLIDSSITPVSTGVFQVTTTIQNNGSPATLGTVPISWEQMYYEIPMVDGKGTLEESVVDLDLDGNGIKTDTFEVSWYRTETRPWDAMINGYIRAPSLCEGPPEDPWSHRTYYRHGEPKLFQLGSETHTLYCATNDYAAFGLGNAFISEFPSPNFYLWFNSTDVSATDIRINGFPVKVNYKWTGVESNLGWTPWTSKVYIIIPENPFEISTGESVIITYKLIGNWRTTPCELAHVVNWSPDNNIRLRWIPFGQELLVELPEFNLLDYSLTKISENVYKFIVNIQNTGAPAISGTLPISWEKTYYELSLVKGEGKLEESVLDLDLNGDGDKSDIFDISWFHNETRSWDALISGVHAYSIKEGSPEAPGRHRTYFLNNGKPKLFQLGSETHILYYADNDYAALGLNAVIKHHPSPNFELYFNTDSVSASNLSIDGMLAKENYTWSGYEQVIGEDLWFSNIYVVPNSLFEITTGQTISFSCLLKVEETVDCILGLIMNWSPEGNTRCIWTPIWEESIILEGPPVTTTTTTTTTTEIPTTVEPTTTEESTTTEEETSKTETPSIPSPGPGFEFPLIIIVFIGGILLKRRPYKK